MKTLQELLQERAALVEQQAALVQAARDGNRVLNATEETSFEALDGQITAKDGEISALEKHQARVATVSARVAALDKPATPIRRSDIMVGGNRAADKPWESFGHFLQAVRGAAEPGIMPTHWDPRLKYQAAASGLSTMVPSDGGFLVEMDMAADLTTAAMGGTALAQRCRRIPISAMANGLKLTLIDQTSRANGSRWGGVRAYWRAEADTVTATQPKLRQIELSLQDLMALAYATDELLRDAAALASVIQTAFAEEFAFALDDAISNGDGQGKPLGYLQAPCLVTVSKETGQAANTVVVENIVKMWSRMHPRSRMNAIWTINQDIEPQLYTMSLAVGTGGVPVYMPAGGVSGQPYSTLFGRPVIPTEFNATLGSAGDIALADFSQYLLIEKEALQVAESIHVRFLYGENTFRFMYRTNGMPSWNSALTPYKGTGNTVSPFVTLAARA